MSNLQDKSLKGKSPYSRKRVGDLASPNPYIMGGSTRNSKIEIDTLVLNLHISFEHYVGELFSRLASAKDRLQLSNHLSEELFQFSESQYFRWNLQRTGVKFYPYVLKCGDITLLLSNRDDKNSIPSARLQMGSLTCQDSAYSMFDRIKSWLRLHGLQVKKDSVSRVDICHDFRLDIKDKRISLFDDDYCICKARTSALYRANRKITGVQYGKGDIVLRMYDKMLEISTPHSINKLDFFLDKWNQKLQSSANNQKLHNVTRIEFQLRKKALDQFLKIGCFTDFLNNCHKIWVYLTSDWFRHCSHEIDRTNRNQDKAKLSFFWRTVQSISNVPKKATRQLKKNTFKPIKPLLDQTRGLLISICAGLGHDPDDYFGMMATVQNLSTQVMKEAMDDSGPFRKKFLTLANGYKLTF